MTTVRSPGRLSAPSCPSRVIGPFTVTLSMNISAIDGRLVLSIFQDTLTHADI